MNRKKPNHLKALAGTNRKDRDAPGIVNLPLVDGVPPVPDWLPNGHAVREWNRLAPILYANKLLTESSLTALGVLCAVFGTICHTYQSGGVPTGNLVAQYRLLAGDFFLTPAALTKGPPSGAKKENRFAKFAQEEYGPFQIAP